MKSGGNCANCWITNWGKWQLNINTTNGISMSRYMYSSGFEYQEKRTTNPELQPTYYSLNPSRISGGISPTQCYSHQVIEPRPVAKPYKSKCRGGW
jgi:hypothetical protein